MKTGIIVALREESETLTKKKIARGSVHALTEYILLTNSGVGPDNARRAVQTLVDNKIDRIISWGCAAALSEELNSGDLLLPERVIASNGENFAINSRWHNQTVSYLSDYFPLNTRSLLESKHIIASASKKRQLFQETGAYALDMESGAIVHAAMQSNIPCLVIRVVADTADMDLPKIILRAMNEQGEINKRRLFSGIALHPKQIPELIKLGKGFQQATRRLSGVKDHLQRITA